MLKPSTMFHDLGMITPAMPLSVWHNIYSRLFRDESFWHVSPPFVVESDMHDLELILLQKKDNARKCTVAFVSSLDCPSANVELQLLWDVNWPPPRSVLVFVLTMKTLTSVRFQTSSTRPRGLALGTGMVPRMVQEDSSKVCFTHLMNDWLKSSILPTSSTMKTFLLPLFAEPTWRRTKDLEQVILYWSF